jgi:ABC-type cobalamin/Fe3+-siderophores transport system ATPase subunit
MTANRAVVGAPSANRAPDGHTRVKKLSIELENCYGIKKLRQEFDFSAQNVFAIYAPNGAMKSSLADTFKDVVEGVPSKDRIFPARISIRNILDENGANIPKEIVVVVRPYDEEYSHTEKTSTLLVDTKLRKEYEQLTIGIEQAKETLLKAIQKQSHSKIDFEREISAAFTSSDDEFYTALSRIKKELSQQKDQPFADVDYGRIFDEKVLGFLGSADVKTAIEGYVQRYNELLAASTYFKKGTFDYYNAGQIARSLSDNGFFDAKHTVWLNAEKKREIRSRKELEEVIAKEKDTIIKDKVLRKKFDDFEKLINKNVTLRDFQKYIVDNEPYLSRLANTNKFKEDILKSYLKAQHQLYLELMTKYEDAEKRRKEIEEEAVKQQTQWEEVIGIFNERFVVPFTLSVANRTAVVLGYSPMIELGFTYHDGADQASIERTALLKALSTGEKKALYILNIIFEIEARKKAGQESIFIVDDIADSFDYKNKYAIIQYLKEIADEPHFRQIILTHNFDFFRTIQSRFVQYSHCLMASRGSAGLSLKQAEGIQNIFANDWKLHFFDDPRKRIACIPFLRNIIQMTTGDSDKDYLKLTSLLHSKTDSHAITQGDLDAIYRRLCGGADSWSDAKQGVIAAIRNEAKACIKVNGKGVQFENKIVLAIAIRVAGEEFMLKKISDPKFAAKIQANQTPTLLTEFEKRFPRDIEAIKTLRGVVLMTPENIHVNSFMYEPILDMSDDHLRKLYHDVSILS